MLQQTQVPRVLPRYEAFMTAFPDASACAAAPLGDVVRAWQGLGYNRRAVNLHRAAVLIAEHGFPDTLSGLLGLPGVGPYTARAVLAYAYEADAAVVDTNVARVLARVEGRRLRPAASQRLADAWLPNGQAWNWNQALMDVGATMCRARSWRCHGCPFAPVCAWREAGHGLPDPAARRAGDGGSVAKFEGSDREGRGRLVAALCAGPLERRSVAAEAGWPDDAGRAERAVRGLVRDGLAVVDGDRLRLP
jgi:A/G-specific adenine glycosylase